ncbi:MAG TPA: glycosyltransferase family 39 protein [Solirubrobacteraceae bacterium]|nr:glycosyltransferase family 39 protein [Solirubrobacteraceae bacterium]
MSAASAAAAAPAAAERRLPAWWPLAALLVLAAALRFSTLGLQSFWYDEAYTPVHVLHTSLSATLRAMVHSENTPPLWYVVEWLDYRLLGSGEFALRLPSALAGVATVAVAWAIGHELAGRGAAIVTAALVAVNPLFVWYSQEARAYGLFVLTAGLALLCFLRAERRPTDTDRRSTDQRSTDRRSASMAAFAASGVLALLSHYFAVFLLIPMVLWLLGGRATRRAALPAAGALLIAGLALVPLISAQGGHGTQWIGRWPIAERLEAIPQYFLTGYSAAPLGHGVELLVGLVVLAGAGLGVWRLLDHPPSVLAVEGAEDNARRHRLLMVLSIAACGVLIPVALAAFGADYLAPRNLVGAMIPVTALIAALLVWPGTGRAGIALAAILVLAFLVLSLDVDLSPRLQRGNWRGVAKLLRGGGARAITTVELGGAPLEYYLHPLRNLPRGSAVVVAEIDETGYAPLRPSAGSPPAPGFRLLERRDVDGLIVYRFISPQPRSVSEAALRRHVITRAHPEVLVPPRLLMSSGGAPASAEVVQMSSLTKKI